MIQPADDPMLGRLVGDGRYQILSLIGVGGMGTVYRAIQHPLERPVALKIIHRTLAADPSAVSRFQREMRITSAIEHPHTVRVYDVGEIDGQAFLAMELLAGRSLRDELGQLGAGPGAGALPVSRLAAIAVQIAKALRALHQAGIVHRDLKPDNIMLVDGYGERDFVKVLDFGIARTLEPEAGFRTVTGAIIGTPAYMSPEQASGAALDARSDLYTLGVILYEMFTGAPPFVSESITALLHAHAHVAPPPPRQQGLPPPPALDGLIAALLAKSPAARPATAEQVIEALAGLVAPGTPAHAPAAATQVLTDQPPPIREAPPVAAARPISVTARLPDPELVRRTEDLQQRRRWPKLVAVAAAIVVALAAGGALLARRAAPPPAPTDLAAIEPMLQAPGEPAWPDACRTADQHAVRALAAAAPSLKTTASATARAQGLQALSAVLETAPERWILAARATASDNPQESQRASARAVALCPAAAVAHNLHGNALQKLERLDAAGDAYRRAAALAPDYPAPRFNLGLLHLRRNDAAAALATFNDLAAGHPDHPNIYLVRADAHRRLGHRAEALADLKEQVRRQPDNATGWLQLGALLAPDDKAAAREAYCRAKQLGSAAAAPLCSE